MYSEPPALKSKCCLPSSMNVSGGLWSGPICEYHSPLPVAAPGDVIAGDGAGDPADGRAAEGAVGVALPAVGRLRGIAVLIRAVWLSLRGLSERRQR